MRVNGVRRTPPPCSPVTMNFGTAAARLLDAERCAVMNVVDVAPGKLQQRI